MAEPNADRPTDDEAARQSVLAADAQAEIEQLKQELATAQDRVLRATAEMENMRRRLQRELEDERRYANLYLLRDLLPVIDNLDRAIAAAEKNPDATGLLEGVRMISQLLRQALVQHHCAEIVALHQPFDPNLHQAILQQPTTDHAPNTVIQVVVPGYQLHDRVVRPAQVIVAQALEPRA
ncbi:MAG: nucleotide exchange factor GrpE [Pirellulales bacterium]|nr:nucleotide exchange factor GrpE [Pirellulales bacterium]